MLSAEYGLRRTPSSETRRALLLRTQVHTVVLLLPELLDPPHVPGAGGAVGRSTLSTLGEYSLQSTASCALIGTAPFSPTPASLPVVTSEVGVGGR